MSDIDEAVEKLSVTALRVKKERDALLTALQEIEWHCEGREDITDNGGPNLAMCVRKIALDAIALATGDA